MSSPEHSQPPAYDFAQLYAPGNLPALSDVNGMTPPEALAWYNRNGYHVRPVWAHPDGYRALVLPRGQRYNFDDLEPPSAAEVAWLAANWNPAWQLGMVMGQRSELWALDADDMAQWDRFEAAYGDDIEPTATQDTGSGKLHMVYRRPESGGELLLRQEGWSREFGRIEVKSKGFLIVAPSVHHKTRRPYRWRPSVPEPMWPSTRLLAARLPSLEDELAQTEAASLRIRDKARRLVAADSRTPIVLASAADVRARPEQPELVEGMMPAVGTGTLFGDTGVYKSFLALNLMLCVGSGAPFLGHHVLTPGRAVYVMGEGQYDAGRRLEAALAARPGFTEENLSYIEQAFPLSDEAAVGDVIAQCQPFAADLRLIVFDSLADFYGGADSENSATDMQRIIAGMRQLSQALGCAVLANAHTGHGSRDEEGEVRQPGRMRGTSRFRQAWDFEWMADGARLVCQKNRYGPKFEAVPYSVRPAGGSLAVADWAAVPVAAVADEEHSWPYPATGHQVDQVTEAVRRTPGLSMRSVAELVKMRKALVPVALAKAEEAGLVANTGTEKSQKWSPGWVWDGCEAMGWTA